MAIQDQINTAVAELVAARDSEAASIAKLQADVQKVITLLASGAQPAADVTGVEAAAATATANAQALADLTAQLDAAANPPTA